MPIRETPLATGEIYHTFNRGIDHRPIFLGARSYQRFIQILNFYQFASLPIKFSQFLILSDKRKEEFLKKIKPRKHWVELICFCLMPNHFHCLLKQSTEKGISEFMGLIQNSHTRYFNTKHRRTGPLLQGRFKAVRVETDEQLLHLSRYIHLNPYSSFVTKTLSDLQKYPWSSLPAYLKTGPNNHNYLNKKIVLDFFKDSKAYGKFVFNQADYQRELDKIKHLSLE